MFLKQKLRERMNDLERDHETKLLSTKQRFEETKRDYEADIKQHKVSYNWLLCLVL